MPASLEIDREAVKMAAIAGVSYPVIARKYGLYRPDGSPDTTIIRQWAFRGKWPVPARIREVSRRKVVAEARAAHAKGNELFASVGKKPLVTEKPVSQRVKMEVETSRTEAVTDLVTDNLQEIGQQSSLRAAQIALRSLSRSPDSLPITSMAEAKSAMQIARIAAGMDSGDGPRISIGLFGDAPATAGAVYDVESGDTDNGLDDDVFS